MIESREPTSRLREFAEGIRPDPVLTGALDRPSAGDALAALRETSPDLRARLDEFLDRYGDRCIGEMKLETLSLRQDPSFVIGVLRNFVATPDLGLESLQARERAQSARFERQVAGASGGRRLARVLRRARRG